MKCVQLTLLVLATTSCLSKHLSFNSIIGDKGLLRHIELFPAETDRPDLTDIIQDTALRLTALPSSSGHLLQTIIDQIEKRFEPTSLPDIDFHYGLLKLNISLTNLKLTALSFEDEYANGIHPVDNQTTVLNLAPTNLTLTFNYSLHILTQTQGNGTMILHNLQPNATLHNTQLREKSGKHVGRIGLSCKSVKVEFDKIESQFSDKMTKDEWELIFDHPRVLKPFLDAILAFKLDEEFAKLDLRHIFKANVRKNIELTVGLSELITFNDTGKTSPDDRIMDMKLHTTFIEDKIFPIEGVFKTDIILPMLSDDYTTLAVNVDTFNKILKVVTANDYLKIAFNQKMLDLLDFKLLKLDTTSLKAFFPKMEAFGRNKGVFFSGLIPKFQQPHFNARSYGGHLSLIFQAIFTLFVALDQSQYYNSTLEQCIAISNCVVAQKVELYLHLTLAAQLTTEKKLAMSYLGVEIQHVDTIPKHYVDPEIFKEKLNNFLDTILPVSLPSFDLSSLFPNTILSMDALDDQRLIIGMNPHDGLTVN